MFQATRTEVAVSVRGHLYPNHSRPEVCNVAKEFDWALAVAVLHLAIRRAHATQRLDSALDALCYASTLAIAQLQQGVFPNCPYARVADAEGLLLRNHANSDFPVIVDRKGVHTTATEVHRVNLREIRWPPHVMLRQTQVLTLAFWSGHIQRHDFLRRQPDRQRTLRAINPGIDLAIHLEFDA